MVSMHCCPVAPSLREAKAYSAQPPKRGANLVTIFRELKSEHARKIIVDEYYAITE